VTSLPTRIALAAGTGVFAAIVIAVAVWFFGNALFLWLEAKGLDPAGAAALTGVAGLVLAGLIGLAARWSMRPSRRPALPAATAANGSAVNGIAADLGALVAQQIATSTRAHPYTTMGAALAAGLAIGAVPELRKTLTGFLKP
jgi:hypothetical protein